MLSEKLLQISNSGAEWVLWLLVALSVVSLATVAERALFFLRTRERIRELGPRLTDSLLQDDVQGALEEVKRDSMVRNVVRAGLQLMGQGTRDQGTVEQAMMGALARERARYEAHLTPLGTIGNNAPFVGLFGTVLGIIQAFRELGSTSAAQAASSQVVISSIGEALVATAVGILVAIPAVAAFNALKSSINERIKHTESLMHVVLQGLTPAPRVQG